MTQDQVSVSELLVADSSTIERPSPGLTHERLSNGRIFVYTLHDAHRDTVDAWIETFRADINDWPVERPFLVLHDFSVKGVLSTPYARSRAQELVDMRPEVKGFAAIVFPRSSLMITMIQLFLSKQRNPARKQRVFATRELALAWLHEAID